MKNEGIAEEKVTVPGTSEETSAHLVTGVLCDELARLAIFRRDIKRASIWITKRTEKDADVNAALDEAALISFCRCFESTNGLRQKPLKQKDIFDVRQSEALRRLRLIRNKIVAHDEQILGGSYVVVVKDENNTASEVRVLGVTGRFTANDATSSLRELIPVALRWVVKHFEEAAYQVKIQHDELPASQRESAPVAVITSVDFDPFS